MSIWRDAYDDWKTRDPYGDLPRARTVTQRETCEHCFKPVPAVSVTRCRHCGDFSYYPARPERRGGK